MNCSKRCRNLHRQCQKPGELSLPREEYRSYLGDKWPVPALDTQTAGTAYGLDYGTVEAS